MEIVLEGNLQHFHTSHVLEFLSRGSRRGSVKLVSADREMELFFAGDTILQARTKDSWSATTEELTSAVCDAFSWQRGTFACIFDAPIPAGTPTLTLALETAIAEAARRREKEVRSGALDLSVVLRVVDQPEEKGKVELSMQEWKELFKIDGKKTLGELLEGAGNERDRFLAMIESFEAAGLVERADAVAENVSVVASSPQSAVAPVPVEPADQPKPAGEDTESLRSKSPREGRTDKMPAFIPPPPRAAPTEAPPPLPAPATDEPIMACVTMDSGDKEMFPLIDDEYQVGRDPQNAIAIADASVSTRHARFHRTEEGFVIEDLKSRNGTFVNDEKIEKKLLSDNDSIRLGRVYLTYNIASEMQVSKATMHGVRLPD
ncbi:MAG TPA: FHA domain-containing protein [Thermoanaerobaculia bacterium]|nr:FHA domain-containing protein [Thermoanaerobaculia bacterium]